MDQAHLRSIPRIALVAATRPDGAGSTPDAAGAPVLCLMVRPRLGMRECRKTGPAASPDNPAPRGRPLPPALRSRRSRRRRAQPVPPPDPRSGCGCRSGSRLDARIPRRIPGNAANSVAARNARAARSRAERQADEPRPADRCREDRRIPWEAGAGRHSPRQAQAPPARRRWLRPASRPGAPMMEGDGERAMEPLATFPPVPARP